jgi:hypothetical protein
MNTIDWLTYFQQNQRDRRGVAWHEPVELAEPLRAPVGRSLLWLAQVERRDADRLRRWCSGGAANWLALEKDESADLLERIAGRFGCRTRRAKPRGWFLTGPWSVAAVIVRDAVVLRLCGALRAAVADPAWAVVADRVLHDMKFHVRCLCEQRGPVGREAWRVLAVWAMAGTWWRQRKVLRVVGVPACDFFHGCWENLVAVEEARYDGRTFTRGAQEQLPAMRRAIGGRTLLKGSR